MSKKATAKAEAAAAAPTAPKKKGRAGRRSALMELKDPVFYEYERSISIDFPNGFAPGQLITEINAAMGEEICVNIRNDSEAPDAIFIVFIVDLTGAQIAIMDAACAAHVPDSGGPLAVSADAEAKTSSATFELLDTMEFKLRDENYIVSCSGDAVAALGAEFVLFVDGVQCPCSVSTVWGAQRSAWAFHVLVEGPGAAECRWRAVAGSAACYDRRMAAVVV